MDERRFDTLVQSLGNRATRRGMLGVLAAVAAVGVAETAAKRGRGKQRKQKGRSNNGNNGGNGGNGNGNKGKKADKVDICHRTGNGSYRLINVSGNAKQAHLRHGDALPGDPVPGEEGKVFGDDCNIEDAPTETFCSGPQQFGPNGWGGWSCPAGMTAVGGSYQPADATVQRAEVAEPGSEYPHYTFGPEESGFVVQNDNDGETITVCVECVPS